MTTTSPHEVTELLLAWGQGDDSALNRLMPIVYDELRRVAHRYMGREREAHVLQTTALVNEAYLRLIDSSRVQWRNRAHFFAISSQLMRRVLVDLARARDRDKRGGGRIQVTLDEELVGADHRSADLIALDDALTDLSAADERAGRVVEMRFFGGLGNDEVAEALGISPETVKRDWRWARAWLLRAIRDAGDTGGASGADLRDP
jgi:RNA polymerase sigma factor (TIGR02999 family)